MSSCWTTYGRQGLIGLCLTPDVVNPPQFYLALCLSAPRANDDGSMLVEPDPDATGYGRIVVPMGSLHWLLTSPEEYTQAAPYTFPTFSADAGLCQGWAFVDAQPIGTGNAWVVGSMVDPFTLDDGQDFVFNNAVLGLYD